MAEQVRTAMQQGTPDDWHRPMKASDVIAAASIILAPNTFKTKTAAVQHASRLSNLQTCGAFNNRASFLQAVGDGWDVVMENDCSELLTKIATEN